MGNHQNVIELNGNKYDATTGKMLSGNSGAKQHNGHVMDGVHHSKKHHTPSHSHHKAAAAHRKAQKPQTLVRHAVHKPEFENTQSKDPDPENLAAIVPKADPERLSRAQGITKSQSISRFTDASGDFASPSHSEHTVEHKVDKKTADISVKEPPVHIKHKPVESEAERRFTQAMNASHAHEAHKTHKKPKKRLHHRLGVSTKALNIGAAVLAGVLLLGFIAYQNVPNLSLKLAASRAGFDAHMPGYQPSGFSLKGPIEYGSGYITLNFQSNSDARNFHITQKVSNWTSQSLKDNFLAANDLQYQTFQDKGKTIYIYNTDNATWVSGGVWYQVEGDSSLNSDQLMRIANSI